MQSGSSDSRYALQAQLQRLPVFARELVAGGVAGGLAKTVVAPLERTKILFQTRRLDNIGVAGTLVHIWRTEGVVGLFRGNSASVLRIVPYAAIHFGVYEQYRRILADVWLRDEAKYDAQTPHTTFSPTAAPLDPSSSTPAVIESDSNVQGLQPAPDKLPAATTSGKREVHPILDLLAGSAAGATAVLLTYPLDLVRTRMAWSTEDVRAGGSHPPTPPLQPTHTAHTPASTRSLHHTSLSHTATDTPQSVNGIQPTTVVKNAPRSVKGHAFSMGMTQTVPSHHLRSAAVSHPGVWAMLRHTAKTEGAKGLYHGLSPTLLGIFPYAGLKFYVYQSLKAWYKTQDQETARVNRQGGGQMSSSSQRTAGGRLPVHVMLLFGGFSGLAAQTATYPLDVLRRRMQVEGSWAKDGMTSTKSATMASTARAIFAQEGWYGFVRGLSINYIKVVPSTAVGFTIYDYLKQYLNVQGNL